MRLHLWSVFLALPLSLAGCQCNDQGAGQAVEGQAVAPGEGAAQGCPDPEPNAVAVVNCSTVMTRQELDNAITAQVTRQETMAGRPPTTPQWRNQQRGEIVRNRVREWVSTEHVREHNVQVPDEELEARLLETLGNVYADQEIFGRFVAQRNVSAEQYRESIRDEMALERFLHEQAVANCPGDAAEMSSCRLYPTEEDLREFYEQNLSNWQEAERVKLRTLGIRVPGAEQEADVLEQIEAIRERIVSGEQDFQQAARAASDMHTRMRGGDLGWLVRGRGQGIINPNDEDAIFAVEPGQVSEPMRTSHGVQLYFVEEYQPAGPRSFEEIKDTLRQPLFRQNYMRLSRTLEHRVIDSYRVDYIEANWGLEPE